jgi:hypothetical protein
VLTFAVLVINLIAAGWLVINGAPLALLIVLYSLVGLWHQRRPLALIVRGGVITRRRHLYGFLLGLAVLVLFTPVIQGYDDINVRRFWPLWGAVNGLLLVHATTVQGVTWPPVRPSRPVSRGLIMLLIVIAVAVSALQILAAVPRSNSDSRQYFRVSEQILGNSGTYQSAEDPGYLANEIVGYGYGLFIAGTRLMGDTIYTLIGTQHILRLLVLLMVLVVLRRYDTDYGERYALAFAMLPFNVIYAHMVLTEALYGLILILVMLLMADLFRREKFNTPVIAVSLLLGVVLVLAPWMRPAGNYLWIPVAAVLVFYAMQWRQAMLVVIGFVVGGLIISGGRWVIDRQFTYAPSSGELYYLYGAMFHDIYDPSNGPIAATYGRIEQTPACEYSYEEAKLVYPGDTREQDIDRAQGGWELTACVEAAPDADPVGLSLLVEAIQANLITYSLSVYDESVHFITEFEVPGTLDERAIGCRPRPPRSVADTLVLLETKTAYQQYVCDWLHAIGGDALRGTFAYYVVAELLISKPYMFGLFVFDRYFAFALGLLMFGMVWLRSPRVWRPLVVISLMIILYQVGTTASAFYTQPRYAVVVTPFYLIIATMLYSLLLSRRIPTADDEPES